MRKKLIAAIIAVLFMIAAAVGVIVYMERDPGKTGDAGSSESTEETVGLSLPTEDPSEAAPEDSFGEDDIAPPATAGSENPGQTEDPDSNETPEDIF